MATYFKLVLADITLSGVRAGQRSVFMQLGYAAVVASLEQKLARVTRLIPKVFSTAVVVVTGFDTMPSVSPDDALVLVESGPERSNLTKASRLRAVNDNRIAGTTEVGSPTGIVASVFFNRCGSTVERLTNAVIHELAHAKSGLDDDMHTENPKGILAKVGNAEGASFLDSDARWLSRHLHKQVAFEMRFFGAR